MKIEILDGESAVVVDTLVAGVREHNFENMGAERSKPLTVTARDEAGNLIGGVAGKTIYKNLLIDVLWVEAKFRRTGLGTTLMTLAEEQARKRDCVAAQVDTLSFQGPAFYAKLGFEVVGRVPGFAGSPERCFLLKRY